MARGRRNTAAVAVVDPEPATEGLRVLTTEFALTAGRGARCVLVAGGADGRVTWSLAGSPSLGDAASASLPPGMHLDTFGITGVPEQAGTYYVDVVAMDQAHPERKRAAATVIIHVEESDLQIKPITTTIHWPG